MTRCEGIEFGPVIEFPVRKLGMELVNRVNLFEGIVLQHDQIGAFTWPQTAKELQYTEEFGATRAS